MSFRTQLNPVAVKRLFAYYENTCQYCFTRDAETLDHIIPRSLQGANGLDNLIPCCEKCNLEKGDTCLPREKEEIYLAMAHKAKEHILSQYNRGRGPEIWWRRRR